MSKPASLPPAESAYLRGVVEASLLVLASGDRLRQFWNGHAADLGLSGSQAKVLLSLSPGEAIPMRALAGRLDVDASNLTALADRLEVKALVERRPHPDDRRVRGLALTAQGVAVRSAFWERLTGSAGPLSRLSIREVSTLRRLLAAIVEPPAARVESGSPAGTWPAGQPVGR